ncbi:MAG: PAS domain S-box protein [Cyclobacteriaceae bacterium]|nr:PAS domain S-box protein [Cyclobacteriaceae bacterium]
MFLTSKHTNRALNKLGFLVVIVTAFLEYISPLGVFITWGYILGVLLTIPHNKKSSTLAASLLSAILILLSLFYQPGEVDSKIIVQNRLYAIGGLLLVTLFAIRGISIDKTDKNTKSLMAGILSHGTEAILLIDDQYKIVLANPFAKNLFGYQKIEIEGKDINTIIQGFTDYPFSSHSEKINYYFSKEEKDSKKELLGKHQNGSFFPIEISFNKYKSGGEPFIVIFASDVTLRKQNEQHLKEKKSELEVAIQELEAFTYSVSHDLRAPLRAVAGYAQMLYEDYHDTIDSEGKRLLQNIQYNAEKMGKLIDDLLTFSRLGKKKINKTTVDLEANVRQIVHELREVTPYHAQVVIHPLHHVHADQSLLNQVIINMISNALKYSSKKENPLIEITSEEKEGEIHFSVRDNGAGFDPNYTHKLFGVFQRLHTEIEFEGTGVGLAIAQRIIHKHNGKMWAEGKEGEGATFYFSLPYEKTEVYQLLSTHQTTVE